MSSHQDLPPHSSQRRADITLLRGVHRNDPTIFSIELANEPHTTPLYEQRRHLRPGGMVLEWLQEMAAFVRVQHHPLPSQMHASPRPTDPFAASTKASMPITLAASLLSFSSRPVKPTQVGARAFDFSLELQSIDEKHMISTGEEGYRADGPTDCCKGNQWLNGGYKVSLLPCAKFSRACRPSRSTSSSCCFVAGG